MGKKPADQTSNNGASGAGDAVDLETPLVGEGTGSGSEDEDDDDDDGDGTGGDAGSIQAQIEAGIAAALPQIQKSFQSEMDRRINSALNRGGRKPADKGGDEENDDKGGQKVPAANVRGARIAFREYLPESIRLLSSEERSLANEFGQSLIQARALRGFDDEDEVGQEVATATAEFLKKARDLYSSRTKRILQQQGALKEQADGQSAHGGDRKPDAMTDAFAAAEKKDRELHPQRYVGK
jgi:hypothetical protein